MSTTLSSGSAGPAPIGGTTVFRLFSPSFSLSLAGLLLAAGAAGCGSDPAPAAKSAGGTANTGAAGPPVAATSAPKADVSSPTAGSFEIDGRILKACGDLPTAKFAFDSASIAGDAATVLQAVARCFATGPLKGKGLKLVGHADARGGVAYNLALGEQRAASVSAFLKKAGVGEAQVSTMSKGSFDATGSDEEGWARDRKVEILLAE